jgi:hypothetical protein
MTCLPGHWAAIDWYMVGRTCRVEELAKGDWVIFQLNQEAKFGRIRPCLKIVYATYPCQPAEVSPLNLVWAEGIAKAEALFQSLALDWHSWVRTF